MIVAQSAMKQVCCFKSVILPPRLSGVALYSGRFACAKNQSQSKVARSLS